jgi:hypothetical protein
LRPLRIILSLMLVALLFGCAGEKKIPTAESVFAVQAYDIAEGLRAAYVSKNFSGMSKFCSKEVYESIRKEIKKFDTVELEFDPQWMEAGQKNDAATMRIIWKGTWTVKGQITQKTGRLILTLSGSPLKVTSIQWGNPFKQPDSVRTLPDEDMLK